MTERGFTLLEVMIAVAILGLSLTAIFSSEVGASNVAARARRQNIASTLARCKMGEIEEIVAIEGLPAIDKNDTDGCCEHAPVEGFECEWIIERVILPDLGAQGDDDGLSNNDGANERLTEVYDDVNSGEGVTSQVLGGDTSGLASLALELGYPILKPFLEEQVRRATVSVRWKEGPKDRGFDVIQYLVSDQPARAEETVVEETE